MLLPCVGGQTLLQVLLKNERNFPLCLQVGIFFGIVLVWVFFLCVGFFLVLFWFFSFVFLNSWLK